MYPASASHAVQSSGTTPLPSWSKHCGPKSAVPCSQSHGVTLGLPLGDALGDDVGDNDGLVEGDALGLVLGL